MARSYFDDDQEKTAEELALESTQSPVNPAQFGTPEQLEQLAMIKGLPENPEGLPHPSLRPEPGEPVFKPSEPLDYEDAVAQPPGSDAPAEPTLEDQERAAYQAYDSSLMQGRRAGSEGRFGAGLQQAGEMLNQAFSGGPKAKPIDPFFEWLRGEASRPEAQAEKDADRRLRMDLQRLKSLRKDKETDDPASDANRAYQHTMRQMWTDAGLDPAMLPLLTQKQIDSGIKSRDLVGKTTGRIESLDLRKKLTQLKEEDQEYDQLVGKTKLRMALAKSDQDRQKYGLQNLKDYTVKINKELGEMPRALEQVLQAVKVTGVPIEKGFEGLPGRLLNKFGRGVDARWELNNPAERKLFQSIQEVANAVIKSRAGMAVSAQEAERLNRALGLGEGGTIADTLVAFEALRERLGELTRSYEEGFRQSIPDNIWASAPNVISSNHPIFRDLYPAMQSSGLQGLGVEEPELGITAPPPRPVSRPADIVKTDITRSAPVQQDITRRLGEPKRTESKTINGKVFYKDAQGKWVTDD